MVAINVNPSQDSQIPEWRSKNSYTFPILLSGTSDYSRTNYGVSGTPTNLILNADTKMVFRHLGYGRGNEKVMEAEIRDLLGLDLFDGAKPVKTAAKRNSQ